MDSRKINALAKDPQRVRHLAQHLLTLPMEWTEWELDFLDSMQARIEPLNYRQAEKLLELDGAASWHESAEGYSMKSLIDDCYIWREKLNEHDQEFVEALKASGVFKLRRRQAARLLRCARVAGSIEPDAGLSLDAPRLADVEA